VVRSLLFNEAFKAIADPTRRKILSLLKSGDLTAGEIASHFDMQKPSVSHHLKILGLRNIWWNYFFNSLKTMDA